MESMISRVVAVAALLFAGCRMFTSEPTMPEFDAGKVSGDELVALLAGVEKVPSLRQRQNLASQLEGRRFTFHDLKRASWRVGKDERHLEMDMRDPGGMRLCPDDVRLFWFTLDVPGVTEELRNFARKTKDTKFSLDPVVKELDCTFGTNFTVTVNRFVPAIELAELPKFDAASITGDQLVDVLRGMKGRMSDAVGEDLAARLDGRELTFTNAQVTGVATIDDDTVGLLFRVSFGKEWDQAFDAGAVIPRKALAGLPWNLWATPWNYGDELSRLKGTVSKQADVNLLSCGFRPVFTLKNVEFDVPWQSEKLPDFDPQAITGEELVSLVSKFTDRGAKAKVDTVLERLNGRRLTFPEVVVQNVSTPADKNKNPLWRHSGRIDLDLSVSCVELRAAGKDGGEFEFYAFMPSDKAKTLSDNARLVDFTGTVVFHRTPFQPDFSTFEDVEFVQADKSEPLPKFDRKTVTGDDIVKLVESRTVALTGEQVKELGRQLDGVRVTLPLDGNQISSWNYYYNPVWDGESGGLELCASYPRRIFRGWREMPILRVSARLKGVMRKEDLPFKDGEKNLRLTGTIRKSDFDSSLKLKDAVVEQVKQGAAD